MAREKVLVSWSGGKDCSIALYDLQQNERYTIIALLTSVTGEYDRITMHGVQSILLEQQVRSLGFTLEKMVIASNSSNHDYDLHMRQVLERYQLQGVSSVVIGDIFLEDVRSYREKRLSQIGLKGIFPLWKKNTQTLAHRFVELGFKAIVTCVDSRVLDKRFLGHLFDEDFLSSLPSSVDPCGENGEFHTFVFDGPNFQQQIHFSSGETVFRKNRFYYCDLKPSNISVSC